MRLMKKCSDRRFLLITEKNSWINFIQVLSKVGTYGLVGHYFIFHTMLLLIIDFEGPAMITQKVTYF